MIVEETKDVDLIKSITLVNYIYDAIRDDSTCSVEQYAPQMDGVLYLVGYVDDKPIGLVISQMMKDKTYVHIRVLKKYRGDCAVNFAKEALYKVRAKWGTTEVYAEIPNIFQNVINFSLKVGFKVCGGKVNGIIRDGQAYPTTVLRYQHG